MRHPRSSRASGGGFVKIDASPAALHVRPRRAVPVFDLHSHSTASDGVLSPPALVERAAARGVDALALTDHDELRGLAEAQETARHAGIELVPGTEISACFERRTIHIVGLHIDPGAPALNDGLEWLRRERADRALRIAAGLAEAGISGALEGARAFVTNPDLVSRTHFARCLVERGMAKDVNAVFRRYLTPGKPGYVPQTWASLSQAVDWIHAAGGIAVLAHPGRYGSSKAGLRRLLEAFTAARGDAIEVISPSHTVAQIDDLIALARVFELAASLGSDFHSPEESPWDLGQLSALPAGVRPAWSDW